MMNRRLLTSVASALLVASSAFTQEATTYDIVVYGGTSGGVTAAIQASRMGKSVVLIEPTRVYSNG